MRESRERTENLSVYNKHMVFVNSIHDKKRFCGFQWLVEKRVVTGDPVNRVSTLTNINQFSS